MVEPSVLAHDRRELMIDKRLEVKAKLGSSCVALATEGEVAEVVGFQWLV